MATANGITFVVGAQTGDASRALNDLRTTIKGLSVELDKTAPSIKAASDGTQGFADSMMRFKREQVGENRMVGFYVRELVQFTGASAAAKEGMSALMGGLIGFASGNIIGGALEVIKLAITAINTLAEGTTSDLNRLRDSAKSIFAEIDNIGLNSITRQLQAKLNSDPEFVKAQTQFQRAAQDKENIQKRLDEATIANAGSQTFLNQELVKAQGDLEQASKRIDEMTQAYLRLKKGAQEAYGEMKGGDARWGRDMTTAAPSLPGVKQAGDKAAKGPKIEDQWIIDLRAAAAEGKAIYAQEKADAKAASDYLIGLEEAAAKGKEIAYKDQEEENRKHLAEMVKDIKEANKEEIKDDRQTAKEAAVAAKEMGLSVGSMVSGLMTQTQTFGQVLAQFIQQMLRAFYEYAVKMVMANAGIAGSEAAAQNAGMGPTGWIVGLAAMAATFAAVSGLVGKMGSASGGWDLPTGGPFPAILHAREMVLPAEHADTIRSLKGGGGGPQIHFHGPVYDKNGVYQMLKDNWRDVQRLSSEKGLDRKGI